MRPVTYRLVSGDVAHPPQLPSWLEAMLRALEARRAGRSAGCANPWSSWQAADELRRAVPTLGRERIEEVLFAASEANGLVSDPKDGPASVRGTINSGLTAKDREDL